MPARFQVTDEALDAHRHIVAVSGEVDLYTAADLRAALSHAVEEGCTSLVIDLTDTHFMDSTGLSTLVSAQKRMRSRGGPRRARDRLTLFGRPPAARKCQYVRAWSPPRRRGG